MRKQPLPGASLCRDGHTCRDAAQGFSSKHRGIVNPAAGVKGKHTPVFALEELVSDIKGVKPASLLLKVKGEISRTHLDRGAEEAHFQPQV